MLVNLKVENVFVFANEVSLSMKANMQIKKFSSNVYSENNFNVVKTIGLFGQNNVGKTKFIECIKIVKAVMLNEKAKIMSNWFSNDNLSKFSIDFMLDGHMYRFDFIINASNRNIEYESFSEIVKDEYGNEKIELILKRDLKNDYFYCVDSDLENILPFTAKNNILIYLIDSSKFPRLKSIKETIIRFAKKIEIIDMNQPPIANTISILKNHSRLEKKVVDFIKNADLYLDDFKYDENAEFVISKEKKNMLAERMDNTSNYRIDYLKLISVYKGVSVPSAVFDSIGTKKIVSIAGYVIDAIENDKILVIDELDSSLHYKMTRAIVSMFNNELNEKAQLIFTAHDINLMDLKKLFRKEQIAFLSKEEDEILLYRLSDFTALEGIRNETDIIEKYKKGVLGAVPKPDLYKTLWSIVNEKTTK